MSSFTADMDASWFQKSKTALRAALAERRKESGGSSIVRSSSVRSSSAIISTIELALKKTLAKQNVRACC